MYYERSKHGPIDGFDVKTSNYLIIEAFGRINDYADGTVNLHTYVKAKGYGQMRDVTDFSMNYCTGQLTSGSYWVEYSHPSYYSFLYYISIASGGVRKRDVEK